MKHFPLSSTGVRYLLAAVLVLVVTACGDDPNKLIASARDYLAKNDGKAAVIQLKNALQANPQSAEARFLLGRALMQSGDYVGAEAELRRALEYKYSADEIVPLLAQAMLGLRQYKKLTDEFGSVELKQPQSQAILKTSLASAHSAQGKADLSQAALSSALAADAKYAPALLMQAHQKARQGDFQGALSVVEGVLANAPGNVQALKMRGDIKAAGSQDMTGALADYRKAVETRPSYVEGHAGVLMTLLRQGKLDEATQQLDQLKKQSPNGYVTRYFSTLLAYQKKDIKGAREQAQQLLKIAPNDVPSLQLAGTVELQANSMLQAEAHFSKALQAVPESNLLRRQLAFVYLRTGQMEKAASTIQPVLKSKDIDAATYSILGQIALQSGDFAKADEYFSQAMKADPKDSRNRIALALSHMAGGKMESGLSELQDIASSDSGATADMALISAHLRRQDFDRALKAIDALEKKQSGSPVPAHLRGRTLLAKKDPVGARNSFERSLRIDPDFFAALTSLAALDVLEKKPDDARRRFENILSKNPKNARALLALAELRARGGAPKAEVIDLLKRAVAANPNGPEPRLLLVDFHLRQKEFKEATSEAQNGVAAIPDNAAMLNALGRAQMVSGDTNQAIATFTKVSSLQPTSPLPHMQLAAAYLTTKNKDAAKQSLRRALDVKPDHLEAQVALVAMAVDAKSYDEALRIATSVQKQRPKSDVGFLLVGDIAGAQKKWDIAAKAYQDGLKTIQSDKLAAKFDAVLRFAGKTAEAQKFSAGWMSEHPKDSAFRMYLADIAMRSKDLPAAEKLYLNLIQIESRNSVAYNNLAWVQGQLKRDTAIGNAEKAVELAPQQPAFLDTLAGLWSDKNNYAKALEWQQKAVALQPNNGLYKVNLAKIHIKGGQKDLARKELQDVAKLGDKYSGQAEVAELLKSL